MREELHLNNRESKAQKEKKIIVSLSNTSNCDRTIALLYLTTVRPNEGIAVRSALHVQASAKARARF